MQTFAVLFICMLLALVILYIYLANTVNKGNATKYYFLINGVLAGTGVDAIGLPALVFLFFPFAGYLFCKSFVKTNEVWDPQEQPPT